MDKCLALGSSGRMNARLRHWLFALTGIATGLAGRHGVAGEVFHWQDPKGLPHFSDRPPAGVAASKIVLPAFPAPLLPPQRPATPAPDASPLNPAPVADRRAACNRARWALAALQTQRPVYRDGNGIYRVKRPPRQPDGYTGPRQYLSDAERSAEIARQQAARETACAAYPELQDPALAAQDLIRAEHCEAALARWQVVSPATARASDDDREHALADINQWCEAR